MEKAQLWTLNPEQFFCQAVCRFRSPSFPRLQQWLFLSCPAALQPAKVFPGVAGEAATLDGAQPDLKAFEGAILSIQDGSNDNLLCAHCRRHLNPWQGVGVEDFRNLTFLAKNDGYWRTLLLKGKGIRSLFRICGDDQHSVFCINAFVG